MLTSALPRLPRTRLGLCLLVTLGTFTALLLASAHFYHTHDLPPAHHLHNGALRYTPTWSHGLVGSVFRNPSGNAPLDPPTIIEELTTAPPLDSWSTPRLDTTPDGPALLMLHVFSTGIPKSRERRELIRRHSVLEHIAPRYRHLVQMRFVLGYPDPDKLQKGDEEVREEEKAIAMEMEEHGDIIRLEGLLNGDNMNNGKTWEWIRWVGSQSPRKAQWVFKCDDDTLPILPNLLDELLALDPSTPTYFGSALGRWTGFHYYFGGMMYGMSWNVVKTIAAADVAKSIIQFGRHEDARTGELMYSLPSSSDCERKHPSDDTCDPRTPPRGGHTTLPPSPDPRTGLVRVDMGNKLGNHHEWWIAGVRRAVAWHGLKWDETWLAAWEEVDEYVKGRYGEVGWTPPPSLAHLALRDDQAP